MTSKLQPFLFHSLSNYYIDQAVFRFRGLHLLRQSVTLKIVQSSTQDLFGKGFHFKLNSKLMLAFFFAERFWKNVVKIER